jgi:hypothetical protein
MQRVTVDGEPRNSLAQLVEHVPAVPRAKVVDERLRQQAALDGLSLRAPHSVLSRSGPGHPVDARSRSSYGRTNSVPNNRGTGTTEKSQAAAVIKRSMADARPGAVAALVVLVALAGCAGLVGQDGDASGGAATTETLTPVPVPETDSAPGARSRQATTPSRYQALGPTCERPPELVVAVQLGALRANDPRTNEGINTTWQFAAPSNRNAIGSYGRFVTIITEQYQPLLDAETVTLGPLQRSTTTARQPVTVTTVMGETQSYVWYLEKQTGNPYDGCWMTTGVRGALDDMGNRS